MSDGTGQTFNSMPERFQVSCSRFPLRTWKRGSRCCWWRSKVVRHGWLLGPLFLVGGFGQQAFGQADPSSELRGSLAGERAAQELRRALTNEVYHLQYGPVRFQTEARVGAAYTDNVFLSGVNPRDDFI